LLKKDFYAILPSMSIERPRKRERGEEPEKSSFNIRQFAGREPVNQVEKERIVIKFHASILGALSDNDPFLREYRTLQKNNPFITQSVVFLHPNTTNTCLRLEASQFGTADRLNFGLSVNVLDTTTDQNKEMYLYLVDTTTLGIKRMDLPSDEDLPSPGRESEQNINKKRTQQIKQRLELQRELNIPDQIINEDEMDYVLNILKKSQRELIPFNSCVSLYAQRKQNNEIPDAESQLGAQRFITVVNNYITQGGLNPNNPEGVVREEEAQDQKDGILHIRAEREWYEDAPSLCITFDQSSYGSTLQRFFPDIPQVTNAAQVALRYRVTSKGTLLSSLVIKPDESLRTPQIKVNQIEANCIGIFLAQPLLHS
jgi:hypothetical protein